MKTRLQSICFSSFAALGALLLSNCAHEPVTQANEAKASGAKIAHESRVALDQLYAQNSAARKLGRQSAGVLVFPHIYRGAFVFGAEGGNGALFGRDRSVTGFYQTAGASYGLQAGVEKFGYALFLVNRNDVRNLDAAGGWEVGTSPSLVVVDRGVAGTLTTKTIEKGVYAFPFNQQGLMAGVSLKGSKITRIHPSR
jgi:lipid-binding SYLF domain-containing protein